MSETNESHALPIYPAEPVPAHKADSVYQSHGLAFRKVMALSLLSVTVLLDNNFGFGVAELFAYLPLYVLSRVTETIQTISVDSDTFINPSVLTPLHREGPDLVLIFAKPLDSETLRRFGGKKEFRNPSQFRSAHPYRFPRCTPATLQALENHPSELLKSATGSPADAVNWANYKMFMYMSGLVRSILISTPYITPITSPNQATELAGKLLQKKESEPSVALMRSRKRRRLAGTQAGDATPRPEPMEVEGVEEFTEADKAIVQYTVAEFDPRIMKKRPSIFPIQISTKESIPIGYPYFVFPYFTGCSDSDGAAIARGLSRYTTLLGGEREARIRNLEKVRLASQSLGSTRVGKEFAHMLWVQEISVQVRGLTILCYEDPDHTKYCGSLLLSPSHTARLVIEGVEYAPASDEELIPMLRHVYPTEVHRTRITDVLGALGPLEDTGEGMDKAAEMISRIVWSQPRTVLAALRAHEPITDKVQAEMVTVALSFLYAEQHYWEVTATNLLIVLEAIVKGEELPDDAPCFATLWTSSMPSSARSLAVFGPFVPCFTAGPTEIDIKPENAFDKLMEVVTSTVAAKVKGEGGAKKKGDKYEIETEKLDKLAYSMRPIKDATQVWGSFWKKGTIFASVAGDKGYLGGHTLVRDAKERDMMLKGLMEAHLRYREHKKSTTRATGEVKPQGPKTAKRKAPEASGSGEKYSLF